MQTDLVQENKALRKIISEIVANLGSGSCSTEASLSFMQMVPEEVKLVVGDFRQKIEKLNNELDNLKKSVIVDL